MIQLKTELEQLQERNIKLSSCNAELPLQTYTDPKIMRLVNLAKNKIYLITQRRIFSIAIYIMKDPGLRHYIQARSDNP